MTEHIVAVYNSDIDADAAARDLEQIGMPREAIRRYRPGSRDDASQPITETTSSGGGFWAWLLGEEDAVEVQRSRFPSHEERYHSGAADGRAVLSVTVDDAAWADQATAILNRHNPLHLDEDQSVPGSPAAAPSATSGEQVIPLAEEQAEIGKRTVDRGATRIRRYVVESPIEKDVTLHGERVTVERRRPVAGATPDGNAFEERTVEVRETEEVPVVEKTARVVEEVAIRKEATERTEHVRDTVRQDQVEVTGDRERVNQNR